LVIWSALIPTPESRTKYTGSAPGWQPILMTFPSFVKRLPPDWYLKNPRIPAMMEKAADCIECGECEDRCPYNLPIREMIKENYELFQKIKAAHSA